MASRRKRGPVAFRPRLSAGLALSLSSLQRNEIRIGFPDSFEYETISSDRNMDFRTEVSVRQTVLAEFVDPPDRPVNVVGRQLQGAGT